MSHRNYKSKKHMIPFDKDKREFGAKKSTILFFISVLFGVIMLVGCGNQSIPVKNSEEFKVWVDKQIDTTEYNVSDGYKSVCYSNHELKTESEKLHGTVSFLDGSQITLPVSKEDMEKSGWELSGEERCDPMGVAVEEYCNKKGQSVFMYPGEEGKYGKLRISRHNAFAGTKPADFLIAEKIALKSSAKEVIEVLGNPMRIMYSEAIKDKQATVCFTYSTGKCVFDVTFSIKENRIIDVSFLNSN